MIPTVCSFEGGRERYQERREPHYLKRGIQLALTLAAEN